MNGNDGIETKKKYINAYKRSLFLDSEVMFFNAVRKTPKFQHYYEKSSRRRKNCVTWGLIIVFGELVWAEQQIVP